MGEQISQFVRIGLRDSDSFRLEEEFETPLVDFDQWANGKDCVGAFRISSDTSELILLFIQWSRGHPARFALIAYTANRSGILFEVHERRERGPGGLAARRRLAVPDRGFQ